MHPGAAGAGDWTLKRETAAELFAYRLQAVGSVARRTLIMGRVRSVSPESWTSCFMQLCSQRSQ